MVQACSSGDNNTETDKTTKTEKSAEAAADDAAATEKTTEETPEELPELKAHICNASCSPEEGCSFVHGEEGHTCSPDCKKEV